MWSTTERTRENRTCCGIGGVRPQRTNHLHVALVLEQQVSVPGVVLPHHVGLMARASLVLDAATVEHVHVARLAPVLPSPHRRRRWSSPRLACSRVAPMPRASLVLDAATVGHVNVAYQAPILDCSWRSGVNSKSPAALMRHGASRVRIPESLAATAAACVYMCLRLVPPAAQLGVPPCGAHTL